MPEIVDLVSSENDSPEKPKIPVKKHESKRIALPVISNRHIQADIDLSLDDDNDYRWTRKAKRRRLDTPPVQTHRTVEIVTLEDSQDVCSATRPSNKSDLTVEDDIEFTSPVQEQDTQKTIWTTMGSEDELSEESLRPLNRSALSASTAALLEEITANVPKRHRRKDKRGAQGSSTDKEPNIKQDKVKNSRPRFIPDGPLPNTYLDVKVMQKERQREDKQAQKEAEKQVREEARIAKKTEKQRAADIASVNKSKLDKNVTTPEMLVDFPTSMNGLSSLTQAREFLKKADSKTEMYESAIPGIIKFRRKIRADFDEEAGHWEPVLRPRIDDEKMIIVYLLADDLARLVSPIGPEDETYDSHLTRVRSLYPEYRVIYLIEGLEKLITKEKNSQNRSYQAAVRRAAAVEQQAQAPAQSVRKKQTNVIVDEAAIETALLQLQIHHKLQIHHTISPLDTGETILAMTQQLSQSRYRDPPDPTAAQMAVQPNFCMSTGQVPTGKGVEDTYLKILQQVIRVTEREATAIAKAHPDITSLFDAFQTRGSKVLQDIMKAGVATKGTGDGAVAAERRIGPATSERLYRIFLGRDDGETVG